MDTICLVTPPTESHRSAEETLALGYLAQVLRNANHKVVVIDAWLGGHTVEELVERLCKENPTLVGFSCYRSNLKQTECVVASLRKRLGKTSLFCGGFGPTFHDEDFLVAGFDAVVRGDAEHVILSLVEALTQGTSLSGISGVTYREKDRIVRNRQTEPLVDLDTIPIPARDSVGDTIARGNFVSLCTSRGCKASCRFCSVFAFALLGSRTTKWRHRSIGNIVEELRVLHGEYGVTHFKIVDDSFLEPPRDESWVCRFRDSVLSLNVPILFRTQVRADRLSERIVTDLHEAGWFSTSVGIENAASSALRRMNKPATREQNLQTLTWLRECNVYVQMGMILFDPYTTMEELEQNLAFLRAHDWVVTKGIFTEMFAAEGTVFTGSLEKKGLLDTGSDQNSSYQIQDPSVRRVYQLLKKWHRSHCTTYDKVIDLIVAPKVLPTNGYRVAHQLCGELLASDIKFFDATLNLVRTKKEEAGDEIFLGNAIETSRSIYHQTQASVDKLYRRYGLRYEAVPNPFLG